MKKLISLVSAFAIVLSCGVNAFAAGPGFGGNNQGGNNQGGGPGGSQGGSVNQYTNTGVKFYIQLNGNRMDSEGNVASQSTEYFTGIVGTSTLSTATDYSYSLGVNDTDSDDAITSQLTTVPTDAEIFENVIADYSGKGYIKDDDGNVISWYALTTDKYETHWYALKYESTDSFWHIDGVIRDIETKESLPIVVPDDPSDIPDEATATPTPVPTEEPTAEPTEEPTEAPTEEPTEEPNTDVEVPDYNDPVKLDNDYAYIFGRDDKNMEAWDGMKRGEMSAIIYRLLKQNGKLGSFSYDIDNTPVYGDTDGRWDRSALEYMNHIGIYGDADTIGPDDYIKRSEAFKVFAVALGFTSDTTLTDAQYAAILKADGYIEGDDNGDLMLDKDITRGELCKIYNEIIDRNECELVTADGTEVTAETYGFEDLSGSEWYYDDVVKATSAFTDGKVDIEKRGIRNALDDYS